LVGEFSLRFTHVFYSFETVLKEINLNSDLHTQSNEAAIVDYSKAIGLDSNDSEAYFNRSAAKFNLGLDGCEDLETSCELGFEEGCEKQREHCKKLKEPQIVSGSIIIGSFRTEQNAIKQEQILTKEGFNNIKISKVGNVYRVSILVLGTKDETENILNEVKKSHKSAWISFT
jgi:hypothetical protein